MPEPTENPIARCLDTLSSTTLFRSQDDNTGEGWDARQCIVCSSDKEASQKNPKTWYYRLAFALFLSITSPLVIFKLLQTIGQAGLASAQAAGGDSEISSSTAWIMFTTLSGGIGSTIITIFTRLQSMIETFSQLLLPNSSASEEKRKTNARIANDKATFLTTCPATCQYWLLRGFFLFCSVTSVAFKAVNGALFGLILALEWQRWTPGEIDLLKTGEPQCMPEGNGLIYFLIISIGIAAFISSFCFDIVRKAASKSHDAAISFMCQGTGQIEENPKVRWSGLFLGFIYSLCSVAYAYVSTKMALTVFSVWELHDRHESTVKLISFLSASTNLIAMMLSAGADTQTMLSDTLLRRLPWDFRHALNRHFSLTCCDHTTPQISNLKTTIIVSKALLILCGTFDTYNNTSGTAASLKDVFTQEFGWQDNAWNRGTAWVLAILSAFTYIANTLWIALKVAANLWSIVPGELIANDEGLSTVVINDERANYESLNLLMTTQPGPTAAGSINGDVQEDDKDDHGYSSDFLIDEPERRSYCCPCL